MLGDNVNVPSAEPNSSPERLKAEGFPVAPIIEAIMDVQFDGGLTADEVSTLADALGALYPTKTENRQTGFAYDLATETLDVQEARSMFRLEGEDSTEVALIRPDGISASQMTPYKSWQMLFDRFARDLEVVGDVLGSRRPTRLAVRYINRIDVPIDDGGTALHEDYLAAHIHMPPEIPSVSDFYLRFAVNVPEIAAVATVQSAVMSQAVEGKASFAVDIDLARTEGLAEDRDGLLGQLAQFRDHKNRLYQLMLTKKALGEFK